MTSHALRHERALRLLHHHGHFEVVDLLLYAGPRAHGAFDRAAVRLPLVLIRRIDRLDEQWVVRP